MTAEKQNYSVSDQCTNETLPMTNQWANVFPCRVPTSSKETNTFRRAGQFLSNQKMQPYLRKVVLIPPPIQFKNRADSENVVAENFNRLTNAQNSEQPIFNAQINQSTVKPVENHETSCPPSLSPQIPYIPVIVPRHVPYFRYPTVTVASNSRGRKAEETPENPPRLQCEIVPVSFQEPHSTNVIEEEEDEEVSFESVFGTKYAGVPSMNKIRLYPKEKLSLSNPVLAKRLSEIVNYKPRKKKHFLNETPILLRPLANVEERQYPTATKISYIQTDQVFQAGPVFLDKKYLNFENQSVNEAINSTNRRSVPVIVNGLRQFVPNEVICRLCGFTMRLVMRRSFYRGRICEYPAYRCLRKGCQTFLAIKKILSPELADKKISRNTLEERSRTLDPDYILNSLMEKPEFRKEECLHEQVESDSEPYIKQEIEKIDDWKNFPNFGDDVKPEIIDKNEDEYNTETQADILLQKIDFSTALDNNDVFKVEDNFNL